MSAQGSRAWLIMQLLHPRSATMQSSGPSYRLITNLVRAATHSLDVHRPVTGKAAYAGHNAHSAVALTHSRTSLVSQRECTMLASHRQCTRLRTCSLSPAGLIFILCLPGAHLESTPHLSCQLGCNVFCACAPSGALIYTPVQSMCLHSAFQRTARAERGHL